MRGLVVGCAGCVWEDVRDARALGSFDVVICVKQIGVEWPEEFKYWATLHPEAMDAYEDQRQKRGFPGGYEIVAPLPGEVGEHGKKGRIAHRISYRWPGMTSSASSGIYGVKVALDMGCDRVVLAGVPMSADGGHFDPAGRNLRGEVRGQQWAHRDSFVPGLVAAVPHMGGRVRSVSGFTAELLGFPTEDWLRESNKFDGGPAPLGKADARSEDQPLEGQRADAG